MSLILRDHIRTNDGLVHIIQTPDSFKFGSDVKTYRSIVEEDSLKHCLLTKKPSDSTGRSTNPSAKPLTNHLDQASRDFLVDWIQEIFQSYRHAYDRLIEDGFPLPKIVNGKWTPEDPKTYQRNLRRAFKKLDEKYKEDTSHLNQEPEYEWDFLLDDVIEEFKNDDVLVVNCGEITKATENQEQLFSDLLERSDELAKVLRQSLVTFYSESSEEIASDLGVEVGSRPYLPMTTDEGAIHRLFDIIYIFLHTAKSQIGFALDAPWLLDVKDHGYLGVSITDFKETSFGQEDVAWR